MSRSPLWQKSQTFYVYMLKLIWCYYLSFSGCFWVWHWQSMRPYIKTLMKTFGFHPPWFVWSPVCVKYDVGLPVTHRTGYWYAMITTHCRKPRAVHSRMILNRQKRVLSNWLEFLSPLDGAMNVLAAVVRRRKEGGGGTLEAGHWSLDFNAQSTIWVVSGQEHNASNHKS